MKNFKKIVIKDKVELERVIDYFLSNDISLSILEDQYALTYPQREFLLQKSMGYSRQQEALSEDYETMDVSESYLEIPHIIDEEYPLKAEEQKELFRRLENIDKEHIIKSLVVVNDELSRTNTAIKRITYKNSNEMQLCDNIMKENNDANLELELAMSGIKEAKIGQIADMYHKLVALLKAKKKLSAKRDDLIVKRKKLIVENPEYARITDTLVKTNVKLANWVIREFFKNIPLPKEEAQGYALMGLGNAINRFDLSYDCNFSTYATKLISTAIKRNFKSMMGFTWSTYCMKLNIAHWREALLEADKERTKPYTPEELADSGLVKYSVQQIRDLDESVDVMFNYSDYYEEPDDSEVIGKKLPCFQSDYDYLDAIDDMEGIPFDLSDLENAPYIGIMKETLYDVLSELDERSQKILDRRFGLTSGVELTLEEVGKEFFISRDRVRQIEAKALRRLRHPSRRDRLVSFLDDVSTSYYDPRPSKEDYVKTFMHIYELRKFNLSYEAKAFFASSRKITLDANETMNIDMLIEAFLTNMQFSEKDAYPLIKIISVFVNNFGKHYEYKYPYREIYDALYKKYLKENKVKDEEKQESVGNPDYLIQLALTKKC